MTRIYIGYHGGEMTIFRSSTTPTEATHGDRFAAVIGPFRTKRGADFMANHGRGNPHVQTVADAERIAAKYAR